MDNVWTAYVDGASRGNPGPAGIGVAIQNSEGLTVAEIGEPLGRTTNNVAEYKAMIRALEEARSLGCNRLQIYTDSELMARQINGLYAVKSRHLYPLYQRVRALMAEFSWVNVAHIYRESNYLADRLSNMGADQVK